MVIPPASGFESWERQQGLPHLSSPSGWTRTDVAQGGTFRMRPKVHGAPASPAGQNGANCSPQWANRQGNLAHIRSPAVSEALRFNVGYL